METSRRDSAHRRTWILGAGMTGLAASIGSSLTALEAEDRAGGICRSFLVPAAGGSYRFEIGGGHWVFGADPILRLWLARFAEWQSGRRRSAVYFPDRRLLVPYPIQNHLAALGRDLAELCLDEIRRPRRHAPEILSDWLEWQFGPTLTGLFFGPFHELYTAGLWTKIAPQDSFKSPLDIDEVERGARGDFNAASGYNHQFIYPVGGMGPFADRLAGEGRVRLNARIARIDGRRRKLELESGEQIDYGRLLSTLPLDRMLRLCGLELEEGPPPATAVLVVNLGGKRGPCCPDEHWVYVPRSRSGFHRVGCYSNVDPSCLPEGSQGRVGFYVERSYLRNARPSREEEASFARSAAGELQEWRFLESVEACTTHWIETAYTWSLPGSRWREAATRELQKLDIFMTGRYGKWRFQGIAESLRDGLMAGTIWSRTGNG